MCRKAILQVAIATTLAFFTIQANAADSREAYQKRMDNTFAIVDVMNAESGTWKAVGIDEAQTDCVLVQTDTKDIYMVLCKPAVVILLAVSQSDLLNDFSAEITNKQLQAASINGLSVIDKTKSYSLSQRAKGSAIYFDLKKSPSIYKEIKDKVSKKQPIEIVIKTEKQSGKFLLNRYP